MVTDIFEAVHCTVVVTCVLSSLDGIWKRFSCGADLFIPCKCPDTISSSLNRKKYIMAYQQIMNNYIILVKKITSS